MKKIILMTSTALCLFSMISCVSIMDPPVSGTIIDKQSKLMWLKDANYARRGFATWKEADDYCKQLNAEGYSDWRLPTTDEFPALFSGREVKELNEMGFVNISSHYWSSNPSPFYIWIVAKVRTLNSNPHITVWPVRNIKNK